MNDNVLGAGCGLVAAVAWSGANVTIRGAPKRLGTAGALMSAQIAGGALAALAALCVEGTPPIPSPRALATLGIAAVGATLAYVGLFASLRRGPVSVCAPVISAWSAITIALGFTLGENPGAGVLAAAALVLAGNVLLTRAGTAGAEDGPRASAKAIGWAVASALGFGIMVPAVDVVATDVGRLWAVPMVWCAQWIIALPLTRLTGRRVALPRGRRELRRIAVPGILEAAGFIAASVGLGLAPLAAVAPASSLSTGLTVLLGVVFLRERLGLAGGLGAAAVSAGVVLVASL